jgi:sRNA-binding regulator protein Hfq
MSQPPRTPDGSAPQDGEPRAATDRPQRRSPPPDATGDEAAYLARLREQRTVVAVQLMDGVELRGIIEYYDRDMIKVNRVDGGGPNVFVRKRHVRMFWEETTKTI